MEKPNLNYIDQLARGDESVKKMLIDVVKEEFPGEKEAYFLSLEKNDFKEIEDIVHRIKHKFSILGLEKSYNYADEFEANLREGNLLSEQKEYFSQILTIITEYLKTI